MNIKVIISVVIALALLGGGAYVVLNKQSVTDNSQLTTDNSETTNSPRSLRDLFASTVAQTCTFSDPSTNSTTEVYVSGGKMRGDFPGGHMITMDQTIYYWMDGQTTGYKMSMAVPTGSAQVEADTNAQVDLDQQLDYKCSTWVVDPTKFVLPTDVTFTDPSAMIQEALGASGAPKIDCSACDSVPEGTARTQCLTALKCN